MKYYFYSFKLFDGSIKMPNLLYDSFESALKAAENSIYYKSPACVEAMIIKGIEVFKEESK